MLGTTLIASTGLLLVGLTLADPLPAQIPEGAEGTYTPHPEAEDPAL